MGNIFYGAVMRNFQTLDRTLHDGDFLQNDGIDDVNDSYGLVIGAYFGCSKIEKNTFKFNDRVQLDKTTTSITSNFGGLHHDYKISYTSVINGKLFNVKYETRN